MSATYTDDQIITFIAFVQETNSYAKTDGKVTRNIDVFRILAEKITARFPAEPPKTVEQWRTKWKSLRHKYIEEKTECNKSG